LSKSRSFSVSPVLNFVVFVQSGVEFSRCEIADPCCERREGDQVKGEGEKHVGKFKGSFMFYFVVKTDEMVLTVEAGVISIVLLKDTGAGIGGSLDFDQV
jgi:hypothetical protein